MGEHLRYAQPGDAEAIAAYHHRCWVENHAHLLPDGFVADRAGELARWHEWLAPGSGHTTVVAVRDGHPIGHTTVAGADLVHVMVDPDHQRQGVGRELLAVAERLLVDGGFSEARLQTLVGNERALELFTSAGWAVTDELVEDGAFGLTTTEQVLHKTLDRRDDHVGSNRTHWDSIAPGWLERGKRSWVAEPRLGELSAPEGDLTAIVDLSGRDIVELGCGTAYVSAWCLRAGARSAIGLDNSSVQLRSAQQIQADLGPRFPLVWGDAERTPFADASFDVAVSEYGAAIWCDPRRWIPEAARILRPGGDLVFLGNSVLSVLCINDFEHEPVTAELQRPQRGMHRFEWLDEEIVEFHVAHGDMIRILRSSGFEVVDLVELHAPFDGPDHYDFHDAEWARQWPGEEIWVARRR